MAEKGYGDFYIKTFLEGLGVPEDMAEYAMDKVSKDFTEEERISLLMKKRKGLSREKMIRFLAGKGLAFEKIISVLGGDDP
jgi:hypothetical protein